MYVFRMYTAYTYSDMRENNIRTYISVHLYDSLSRAEQGGTLLFLYKRNVCRNNKANTCVYMVRRLAFPAPPPPPNGMVWQGGGVTGSQRGPGSLRKPYASHEPCNVGRVPVLINLNLYVILETLHPSLNPA